jgi:RND family efflux transporter MFP subunit
MVLSTEVAGKVERVFVDVGDAVPRDKRVVCLDDTFSKIDIDSTKNEIELAKVDVTYYKKQVIRYKELADKKSASVSELDNMERLLGRAERKEKSKQLLKQRQQETLSRHCISAPKGWLTDERYVESGQWLDVGKPVVKVGDYSKLLVPFSLTVNELNTLEKNQQNLMVWLPEYKQSVPASVERISPSFDEKSRKVQVDLLLERNIPVQRGGLRVELKLNIADPSNTFLISTKALEKRFEEVWVNRKDGQSLRVDLRGNEKEGLVRISSPKLKVGDQFKMIQH